MDAPRPARILVVANRTAATPWLLQEVEQRVRAGPCEVALLVPPAPGRAPDWAPADALRRLERAAGRTVERVESGADPFAAIERAVGERQVDEILVSIRRARGPKWLRRDLLHRIDGLGVPVTAVMPGARTPVDQTVLRVRWDDEEL